MLAVGVRRAPLPTGGCHYSGCMDGGGIGNHASILAYLFVCSTQCQKHWLSTRNTFDIQTGIERFAERVARLCGEVLMESRVARAYFRRRAEDIEQF